MNLNKSLLALFLVVFCLEAGFGQAKEDAFLNGDPVKLVHVFPNPTTDYLNVKFENPVSKVCHLTLHNVIGNTLELDAEIVDDYEIRIRVKDFPVGYYFLAVHDEHYVARGTFKFLKR